MRKFGAILVEARLMAGFARPWFVSGGWAIDLFLGEVTREHGDIEIGIYRDDQEALQRHLTGWSLEKAVREESGGRWKEWRAGEALVLPVHQVRARRFEGLGEVEFFLNERTQTHWRTRRHAAVMRPVGEATMAARCGVPILVPEIQLLFKAKQVRPKDEADFVRTLPRLNVAQRAWLAAALRQCHPEHAWISAIDTLALKEAAG